jgi:hypothetical protein
MAAVIPVPCFVVAALVVWLLITAVAGVDHAGDVLFGVLAPAIAACASWAILARIQRVAPEHSTQTMIVMFTGKAAAFGLYLAAILGLRVVSPVPFILGFSASFVALQVIQTVYLRRLFLSRV